ncbi:MAG TPA: YceI family protein [Thermoanaerobaculia bacterium]
MKSIVRSMLIAALVATPLFAQNAPETWVVDKSHSTATFKVRHMMANVVGQFRTFDGNINIDRANPSKSNVEFTIDAASIDTGNANRDKHLRNEDFFDVEKFPTITFKSTAVAKKSENEFAVTGDLTMHGVTKRVTLPVSFLGFGKTARGEKAGFEIETTVNRKDYGIVWNKSLDEGGLLLGEDVKVTINLEVDRKVAAPAAN